MFTALSMVAVCGFAALAVDAGVLMAEQQKLQDAADAAALAGAASLLQGASDAVNAALQYAAGDAPAGAFSAFANEQTETVRVSGTQSLPLWFARVVGVSSGVVHAAATAEIGPVQSLAGVVPIAVPNSVFTYGQTVVLSEGAGSGQSGNYGFLDFSGQGANGLESDLEHGYSFALSVGQSVATKPGVMSGPVAQAIQYRLDAAAADPNSGSISTVTDGSPRVMLVPIVNTLDVSGKKDVTILGFAAFYLDGLEGNGGHQEIVGQFIQLVTNGTVGSGSNYGTYGVRLIS